MGFTPIEWAVMGTAMAASYAQQYSAASNQADYQARKNQIQNEATIENYKQLDKAEQDIMYNSAQDSLKFQIEALEANAQQESVVGATGVTGGSVDHLRGKMKNKYTVGQHDIQRSRDQQLKNIDAQAKGMQQRAEASLDRTPIKKPSILQAASTGLTAAQMVSGAGKKADNAKTQNAPVRDSKVGGWSLW